MSDTSFLSAATQTNPKQNKDDDETLLNLLTFIKGILTEPQAGDT